MKNVEKESSGGDFNPSTVSSGVAVFRAIAEDRGVFVEE
jgi:hypothetical protein